jgi:hypothetical protein
VTRRIFPALSLVALALVASACSSGSSASHADAVALLTKSESAVQAQTSLHFVDKTTIAGKTETIAGQFSTSAAQETVSTGGTVQLSVRLVSTAIYLQTTSTSVLESVFSLTAAQAAKATGIWIKVLSTDSQFNTIAQSLTLTQAVGVYYPTKAAATLGSEFTIGSATVLPLSASTTPATKTTEKSTVNIVKATSLPISGKLTATQGSTVEHKSASFTGWGTPVVVTAPASSTPLATVKA